MIQNLIKEQVSKLNIEDINRIAKENNIILNLEEANNILIIVKRDWYQLVYGNSELIFENNKDKVSHDNYDKLRNLFYFFKKKYQRFL